MLAGSPCGIVAQTQVTKNFDDGSNLYKFELSNDDRSFTCRLFPEEAVGRMEVGASVLVLLHPTVKLHAAQVVNQVPLRHSTAQ